ncbi:MAG: hypothetical protein KF819_26760 [Labilithrix sp.]|nr:hypothetical protein [Labilithrix sp.]
MPFSFLNHSLAHSSRAVVLLAALALAGCSDGATSGSSGDPASSGGSSGDPTSSGGTSGGGTSGGATPSNVSVDITVSGDFEARLEGKAGTCGGVSGGASFRVTSDALGVSPTFEIAVVILEEEDWAKPPTVLNVTAPNKTSYTWSGATGTVVAQRDRSRVDIDIEMKQVAAPGTVKVKGSIVCKS